MDAGSALNHDYILEHPIFEKKKLHILTLAPEANCFWKRGVSYLFEDLRNIPTRDSSYDTIVCLSTLEHVGCDNTWYSGQTVHRERHSEDFVIAMQELSRVLKPGGRLFLTVPFGSHRHFGASSSLIGSCSHAPSKLLARQVPFERASFGIRLRDGKPRQRRNAWNANMLNGWLSYGRAPHGLNHFRANQTLRLRRERLPA